MYAPFRFAHDYPDKGLAPRVQAFELRRESVRFARVICCKEAKGEIGLVHAGCRIDARCDIKADIVLRQFLLSQSEPIA